MPGNASWRVGQLPHYRGLTAAVTSTSPPPSTTARLSEEIGRKLEAARGHVEGGMLSRRKLNTAFNLKERREYARAPGNYPRACPDPQL